MMRAVLYEKVDCGGLQQEALGNMSALPAPLDRAARSVSTQHDAGWTVFWAGRDYDSEEDALWVEGARDHRDPNLINLLSVPRAHGNRNWADRIRAVSFSSIGPVGSSRNLTIYFRSGRLVCGVSKKALHVEAMTELAEKGRARKRREPAHP